MKRNSFGLQTRLLQDYNLSRQDNSPNSRCCTLQLVGSFWSKRVTTLQDVETQYLYLFGSSSSTPSCLLLYRNQNLVYLIYPGRPKVYTKKRHFNDLKYKFVPYPYPPPNSPNSTAEHSGSVTMPSIQCYNQYTDSCTMKTTCLLVNRCAKLVDFRN